MIIENVYSIGDDYICTIKLSIDDPNPSIHIVRQDDPYTAYPDLYQTITSMSGITEYVPE
jgi:hypothetical protein